MSNIYLFNYNNYFNRIIKKGVQLSDYGTPIYSLKDTNFYEGDNIRTSHTFNYGGSDGDYIVVCDKNDKIKSRWFIIDPQHQRGGQQTYNLRRDVVADYYNQIINAPALINRAMIKDVKNPLIFNSEGFNLNQIKKGEIPLYQYGTNDNKYYVLLFNSIVQKSFYDNIAYINNPVVSNLTSASFVVRITF